MAFRNCPVCMEILTPFTFNRVETDVCGKGCGIWLDKGELAAIEQSEDSLEAIDEAFPGLYEKDPDVKQSLEGVPIRTCPVDHAQLERYEWNLGSGLVFDRCPGCEGLWLDAGELEGYSQHVKKFRQHPPELTADLRTRMAEAKVRAESEWDMAQERTANRVVPWDLWFIDDLARLMLRRTLNRLQ